MIALDDVVLRDDLDPRLGERDDDLIAQYADIFDALPPIEINQHKELIDGWHRVRAAEQAKRTEIAYVVVETVDDDDLSRPDVGIESAARCSVHPRSTPNSRTEIARARFSGKGDRRPASASARARFTVGRKNSARGRSKSAMLRSSACRDKGRTTARKSATSSTLTYSTAAAEMLQNSKTEKIAKRAWKARQSLR